MPDKFRVDLTNWPDYFENFVSHCNDIADKNNWDVRTVMDYQLRPMGGKVIKTSTQGWYLRWDEEKQHTMFVLRWS